MDNLPLKYYNNLKLLSQYNDQLEKISYSLRIESGIYIFIAKEILNKYNSSFTRINFLILIISSIITFLESIKLIIQRNSLLVIKDTNFWFFPFRYQFSNNFKHLIFALNL